mmetsp:Transcript_13261/g.22414  ORF Transcript_13261/g.22414 Transcript_13261/m.22414 type:complete len:100 (+) Transcript_13261:3-302(+)
MIAWEDACDLAACLDNQPTMVEGVKEYESRRIKRANMVQAYSAQTYMGRPSPTFILSKFLSLFRQRGKMKELFGGYEPLEVLPVRPPQPLVKVEQTGDA